MESAHECCEHDVTRYTFPVVGTAARFGVVAVPVEKTSRVGISAEALRGGFPLHALRVEPEGSLSGWFIWCGEMSDEDDFFEPLHAEHLSERCPIIIPYLELPPKWRLVLAPRYEDVWHDPEVKVRN